ncbi:MAG: hypothetical protein RBU37_00375 [Myxococcota bacterium]|nr:hypothetical protein [Myxococcota bacterium]
MAKDLDEPSLDPDEIDDNDVLDFEGDDEFLPDEEIEKVTNIVTWCPSCNANRQHTLIEDEDVPIVICSECNEEHSLDKEPRSRARSGGGAKGLVNVDELHSAEAARATWKKLTENVVEAELPRYDIRARLKVQDKIVHPKFGVGIVFAELSPQKVDVLFSEGTKKLVCNRG